MQLLSDRYLEKSEDPRDLFSAPVVEPILVGGAVGTSLFGFKGACAGTWNEFVEACEVCGGGGGTNDGDTSAVISIGDGVCDDEVD